jgi:hypothetical protein
MQPDWLQHDRPAAYVIVKLYSFTTLISLRLHFRTEKFGARFKNVFFNIYFFKIA